MRVDKHSTGKRAGRGRDKVNEGREQKPDTGEVTGNGRDK